MVRETDTKDTRIQRSKAYRKYFSGVVGYLTVFGICSSAAGEVVEKILAVVNDETITLTESVEFRDRLKKKGLVDEALLKISDKTKMLKDQRALIDHMIYERVMDAEVKKQDLEVTIEKVEREIRGIAKQNGINRAQLKETLSRQGVIFSDYQDFVKKSLERRSLIEKEITSKIKISDEDISSYYVSKYGAGESQVFEYTLAQILVPKGGTAKDAEKKIRGIYDKLTAGSGFEDMANQFSEDPNFSQGGLLGTFKENELNKEYREAVKNLNPNQFSKVFETAKAFHIIKLKKRGLIENPAIQGRKNEIHEVLLAQEFERRFKNWLQQKREQAFVRIN